MRLTSALLTCLVATSLVVVPLSSASAHERHYHGLIGGLFGVAGDIVVGAATIAAAPFYIIAGATSGHRYADRRDDGYYGRRPQNYGPRGSGYYQGYDGRNSEYYSDAYGPDRYPRSDYRPPQDRYYGPPEGYAPPSRGYYASRDYARDYSDRARYDDYSARAAEERSGPDFDSAPYDEPRGDAYDDGPRSEGE